MDSVAARVSATPAAPLAPLRPGSSALVVPVYAAAVFLAAALLFAVQPMIARMVLPRLGGSPEVWNTSMVFFQLVLLVGYLYADRSVRLLGPRRQPWVHAALLFLPLLALPVALPEWIPPAAGGQSPWLMAALTVAAGAPALALATTGPLLQRWLAGTRHRSAADPYFLYAASNAGSLTGLLAYPFGIELLPLSLQSRLWAFGYAAFLALAGVCALHAVRNARAEPAGAAAPAAAPPVTVRQSLFWGLCAFVPTVLLLATTHQLSTDLASLPLLWVVPLVVYLVTYVVAFARRPLAGAGALSRFMAMAAVALTLARLGGVSQPAWLVVGIHLSVLAAAGLLCHTRLALARPPAARLTGFYVVVATGGALGGAFAALLGPILFDDLIEYPIALVLACLLRVPTETARAPRGPWFDLAVPAGLALYMTAALAFTRVEGVPDGPFVLLTGALPVLACYLASPRRLAFALGIAVLTGFGYSMRLQRGDLMHAERTFFGIHRVTRDPARTFAVLMHGSTVHGIQSLDPARAGEPLGYYHPSGPGGGVLRALAERPQPSRVALVGLGTGALAALSAPHQRLTLYEIDPAVVRIAEDPALFTYLARSAAPYEVVVGDGRVGLAAAGDAFDLIVLDAFSSGTIPIHLMTREAMTTYLARLRPGGSLLFHVSNDHLELAPILATLAADLGLAAIQRYDVRLPDEREVFTSHWVMLARRPEDFTGLLQGPWQGLSPIPGTPLWTDERSNILSVLRWP